MRDLVFGTNVTKMNAHLKQQNMLRRVEEEWTMLDSVHRIYNEFRARSMPLLASAPGAGIPEYKAGAPNQVFTIVQEVGKDSYFRFDPNAIIAPIPISPLWKKRLDDIKGELQILSGGMDVRVRDGVFTFHVCETGHVMINIVVHDTKSTVLIQLPAVSQSATPVESKDDANNQAFVNPQPTTVATTSVRNELTGTLIDSINNAPDNSGRSINCAREDNVQVLGVIAV